MLNHASIHEEATAVKLTRIRFFSALTALMVCMGCVCSALADHEVILPYPKELQIAMETETWTTKDGREATVDIPTTCQPSVNALLRETVQELWDELEAHAGEGELLLMTATYRVSGESWAGFFFTGRSVQTGRSEHNSYDTEETTYLCYRTLSFDLQDGAPLRMADVFPENSSVFAKIGQAAREQLEAYYADLPRNDEAVARLTKAEAIADMAFLPSAGRFLLTFPLWEALEGKRQLVQLSLMYADYQDLMVAEAQRQTDNSARPILALTFDDGPSLYPTKTLLRNLDRYGASATFFCVGTQLQKWPDVVRRELDAGHAVGSHTMKHTYAYLVNSYKRLVEDREEVLATHAELLGVEPFLFRAPGGSIDRYRDHDVGWPLIQWRTSAGDTGNNTMNALVRHVTNQAKDGYIILMHDIYKKTTNGAEGFLAEFVQRGFMMATVEELMSIHQITIEPNVAYYDAYSEPERKEEQ